MVTATLTKYLVTTLAGVDFVVGEIASQRDFEVFLESGVDRSEQKFLISHQNILEDASGRGRILEMMEAREMRLDDLCKANRHPDLFGAEQYVLGKDPELKLKERKKKNERVNHMLAATMV